MGQREEIWWWEEKIEYYILKVEKGATSQRMQEALEARKCKGMDSSLGPPQEANPADILISAQWKPYQTLTSVTNKFVF